MRKKSEYEKRMKNEWGFTNDESDLEQVVRFREDAIMDGWEVRPTYPKHEPIESACSLKKDGFKMSILTRTKEPGKKWKYEACVHIWGPDGLAIEPPVEYDMEVIRKGLRVCGWCQEKDVETERVAFANRCCKKCAPEAREKLEFPGWCN